MKKFTNIETSLVSKWLGNEIDFILFNAKTKDKLELISIMSEEIEEKIKGDLQYVSEGFVSEIIQNSLEKVDYNELIDYYND